MFGFQLQQEDTLKQKEKIKQISEKQLIASFSPTWEQVWSYGYTPPKGKYKKGIFHNKNTPKDLERLKAVKLAVENGELTSGVDNLKRFTKTHALRLYSLLEDLHRDIYIADLIKNCPGNYELITEMNELENLVKDMKKEEFISVDTETSGLRYFHGDQIVGYCFGLEKANRFVYIPVKHNTNDRQLPDKKVIKSIKPILESSKIKKIFHNYKFDAHMLYNSSGIKVKGMYWDTLSAQTLLFEEEESYALKNLLTKYKRELGFKDDSKNYESLFGKGGFENTPLDIARYYGSHDCKGTLALFRWQESFFKKMPKLHKLLLELELPQLEVSLKMEQNGMLVDLEYAAEYTKTLQEEIKELEQKLVEEFGELNWNSPLQIQKLLYEELKLEDVSKKKSTDAKTLKKLVKQKPELQMVLDYREKNKLLTTYYEPLPKLIASDGRIHGQFNAHKTVTSRYNSEKPNLQNIAPNARPIFIPAPGKVIFGCDYSQVEPLFLAFQSNDKNLQRPYIEGWDFYSSVASSSFKKPIEECGDGSVYRRMSKLLILSSMYGIHEISLAESMQLPLEEVKQIMRDFYESNPDMARFKQDTFDEIDKQGYTTTFLGRKRRFPNHIKLVTKLKELKREFEQKLGYPVPENIFECKGLLYQEKKLYWELYKQIQRNYRMGFNVRIQGSCAEIMKKAMLSVHRYCENNPEFKLIATIHDEILVEAPETVTKEQVKEIEDMMVNAMDISPLTLKVDTEFFPKCWGKGISKDEWFAS
jgi:DNA polymerase I